MIGKTILHLPCEINRKIGLIWIFAFSISQGESGEIINSRSHSFLGKRDFVIFKNIIILLSHGVNKILGKLPTPSEKVPIAPRQAPIVSGIFQG